MKTQFDDLLVKITGFLENEADAKTVVGEPFMLGEFSCIPVVRLGMGFGTGSGEGDDRKVGRGEGGAAGGGLGIEPIGFLVSRDDNISFISTKANSGLAAAFEKVPDLLEKYLEARHAEPLGI